MVIGCEAEIFHLCSPPYSRVPSVPVISAGVYSSFKMRDQLHLGGCTVIKVSYREVYVCFELVGFYFRLAERDLAGKMG